MTASATRRATTGALGTLAVLALAGLGGCNVKPTARFAGLRPVKITSEQAELVFVVEISNPYPVALPVLDADYELASGGKAFLDGKADLSGTVPALGSKLMELPAKVNFQRVMELFGRVRPGEVLPYEAELGLAVDAPGGLLRLPVRHEGQLPIPAVPEVAVQKVDWQEISAERATGTATLELTNPNAFEMTLSKMEVSLTLAGTKVAEVGLAEAAKLLARGGTARVRVPLNVSMRNAGLGVLRLLQGDQQGYRLTGRVDLATPHGPMQFDIDRRGTADVDK